MTDFVDQLGLQRTDPTQTLQSGATATGNGTSMAVRAMEAIALNVTGITTATIIIEGTSDNSTWNTLTIKNLNTGASATSITANGFYTVEFEGLLNIRARISAYTSGTISVSGAPVNLTISGGNSGAETLGDGSDTTEGAIADAAVVGDTSGTISAKLRGLSKILNSVWNSTANVLNIAQNASVPVSATLQSAASANGNGTVLNTTGMASARLTVAITGTATVNFEGTEDGTTYFSISSPQSGQLVSTTIASGMFDFNVTNLQNIRARISGVAATPSVTVTGHTSPVTQITHTISIQSPSSIGDGNQNVTTSGTAVQVTSSSTACKNVTICAKTTNTGVIAVGASDVVAAASTRKGIPLNPGDSISIDISDVSKIWIDSTISGEGVTYLYTN